jgi:hypothetical protein
MSTLPRSDGSHPTELTGRRQQGEARADPMAEPFGAKGSGGSLRYGSEMSNALGR